MVFKILCVLLGGVAQPVWNLSWRLERRSEGRSVAVVIENAADIVAWDNVTHMRAEANKDLSQQ